jgi:hypothetical protein
MARRVSYALDDGTRVEFETEPVDGWREVGAEEVIAKIDEAVSPLVGGAKALLDRLKAAGPEGVEVKFGVKVSGTANWVIAKAATEANFEVTLTWSPGGRPGLSDVSPAG